MEMKMIEKEINNKIENEKQEIINQGRKLRGKFAKISKRVLAKYDLSQYEIQYVAHAWHIRINEKGTADKNHQELIRQMEIKNKSENFIKRVKSGEVEKSISKWIEKNYEEYRVEYSRSMVKSESFYIVHEGEKILKLSLHNTIFQEVQHGTPFIDLNEYASTITLKKEIERRLSSC